MPKCLKSTKSVPPLLLSHKRRRTGCRAGCRPGFPVRLVPAAMVLSFLWVGVFANFAFSEIPRPAGAAAMQTDILPIKPLEPMKPQTSYQTLWLLGSATAIAAIAMLLVALRKKRSQSRATAAKQKTGKTPRQITLEALSRLEEEMHGLSPDIRNQGFTLSMLLRTYLVNSYRFPATRRTTEETRDWLKETDFSFQKRIHLLLSRFDRIKFSAVPPSLEELQTGVQAVREAITRSDQGG